MTLFKGLLPVYLIYLLSVLLCSQRLVGANQMTNLLSARCRSRCLAKEIETWNITMTPVKCTTNQCLACLKPCEQRKKEVSSCNWLCSVQSTLETRSACKESCKFLKHLHVRLQDGNYSCLPGIPSNQCILMRPEDVQVVVTKRKKNPDYNYTISWNGSWPSSTVFVVVSREQKKLASSEAEWTEIGQTTSLSVRVADLLPLAWYQFKVVAVNEYGASPFSVPTKFIFSNLRRPGQPRDFKVMLMQIVKGHVDVDVSWRKPDSAVGVPIYRYKLYWSVRYDQQLEKFMDLEVQEIRLKGNVHQYTIKGLLQNTTYMLEIQAMTRWQETRKRSRWLRLRIRTPASKEGDVPEKPTEYVKKISSKVKGNVLIKKEPKTESEVLTKPTTITRNGTTPVNADDGNLKQTSVLTPNNSKAPNVEAKRSIGHVLRISTYTISFWLCVAVAVLYYL